LGGKKRDELRTMEVAIALLGLVLAALTLAFQQGWLPPKYHMAAADPYEDPVTAKVFGPVMLRDVTGRKPRVVLRYMVPQYEADGFRVVRILAGREFRWGRECHWTGRVSDGSVQTCVLMARPRKTNPFVDASHPSGLAPYYAASTNEVPDGVNPETVAWVHYPAPSSARPVLDTDGREWRLSRPSEEMILVHRT
jgi:hypothetical protein